MSPRHYAAQIIAERSKEKRRQMLAEVPAEWRALVRRHVENEYSKRA